MALSAALPPRWDPILVYVGITVILGVIEWTGLARSVRGKLLAVREEDFATAAVLMACGMGLTASLWTRGWTRWIIWLALPIAVIGFSALLFRNAAIQFSPVIPILGFWLAAACGARLQLVRRER